MPSNKNPVIVSFRTTQAVKDIGEIMAKKKGQTKSEYYGTLAMDAVMNLEEKRVQDVINDFLDICLPHICTGMDQEAANKMVEKLKTIQNNYFSERLEPYRKVQGYLTDMAIRSYLKGTTEAIEGKDGFIINQCVKAIYDTLLAHDLITYEEWLKETAFYDMYMKDEGLQLLQKE